MTSNNWTDGWVKLCDLRKRLEIVVYLYTNNNNLLFIFIKKDKQINFWALNKLVNI